MILYTLIAIALTTIVLLTGLVLMTIGGRLNKKFSSRLMSMRVFFQAVAIFLLAVAYFLKHN